MQMGRLITRIMYNYRYIPRYPIYEMQALGRDHTLAAEQSVELLPVPFHLPLCLLFVHLRNLYKTHY